jgi:hypothetical protein
LKKFIVLGWIRLFWFESETLKLCVWFSCVCHSVYKYKKKVKKICIPNLEFWLRHWTHTYVWEKLDWEKIISFVYPIVSPTHIDILLLEPILVSTCLTKLMIINHIFKSFYHCNCGPGLIHKLKIYFSHPGISHAPSSIHNLLSFSLLRMRVCK